MIQIQDNLFIPLPIDGHLDFFQFGAITYEAAINIHIQVFGHMLSFLLGKYQEVEWIGHMVDSFLTFSGMPNQFPKWLYHFTILPSVKKSSSCSTSFQHLILLDFFNFRCSKTCVVVSNFAFNCRSDVEHLLMSIFATCVSSFMKCLINSFVHFY